MTNMRAIPYGHPLALLMALVLCLAAAMAIPVRAHGLGSEADAIRALEVDGRRVVDVSIGSRHSAAVISDGSLYTWGNNFHGELGDGTTENSPVPQRVEGLPVVVDVELGVSCSAAIASDGSLWMWGWNRGGELGNGTTIDSPTPQRVEGLSDVVDVDIDDNPGLGAQHVAAVTSDGALWTWGDRQDDIPAGQEGIRSSARPIRMEGLPAVARVFLGAWSQCAAIDANGGLWTWGIYGGAALGHQGDPGSDDGSPQRVEGIPPVVDVALGYEYTLAVAADGGLYAWGTNDSGGLGVGDPGHDDLYRPKFRTSTPTRLGGLPRMRSVSAYSATSSALAEDGTVWFWGYRSGMCLGAAGGGDVYAPQRVSDLPFASSLSCSAAIGAVIAPDGSLWMWGDNADGQLGDGSTNDRATPVKTIEGAPVSAPASPNPDVTYVHRLYNALSGEHLYTTDANEAETLANWGGWTYEGVGWSAPRASERPIYRLFNPYSGEHLYTTDKGEYDALERLGWSGEGAKMYSADPSGTPTYRLRNPWGSGPTAHHYTTDANERTTLLKAGYADEGIAWYGL